MSQDVLSFVENRIFQKQTPSRNLIIEIKHYRKALVAYPCIMANHFPGKLNTKKVPFSLNDPDYMIGYVIFFTKLHKDGTYDTT